MKEIKYSLLNIITKNESETEFLCSVLESQKGFWGTDDNFINVFTRVRQTFGGPTIDWYIASTGVCVNNASNESALTNMLRISKHRLENPVYRRKA